MKKKYLTFHELCKRWNITVQELHHLVGDNKMTPSIIWTDYLSLCWWQPDNEVGELILVHKDIHSDYEKSSQWLYLRCPHPKGANKYAFVCSTNQQYLKIEEFTGEWFQFYYYKNGKYVSCNIDQDYVEKNAVFWMDDIEDTELLLIDDWGIKKESNYKDDTKSLTNTQISNKERETLLVIIAALAKEARIDISKISKSGELIANMTQIIGCPVGATTIETHLKKIPVALQNRTK